MSSSAFVNKYLDVDSTYRDRTTFPLASEFDLIISQSGARGAAAAIDPVALATPDVFWQSNMFARTAFGTPVVAGVITAAAFGSTTSPTVAIVQTVAGTLQTAANYYAGAVLVDAATGARARVTAYSYLGAADFGRFDLEAPGLQMNPADAVTIADPTDVALREIFVPTGSAVNNAYVNELLVDETTNTFATITSYDAVTRTARVDVMPAGWSATDAFSIRRQPTALTGVAGAASTRSEIQLGVAANALNSNLIGSFVRFQTPFPVVPPEGESSRVIAYDSTTTIASVSPPFSVIPVGFAYEILSFSYDNFVPFSFSGSKEPEDSVYDVRLVSLVLPNSDALRSNGGGFASDRPRVYVQLARLDNPTPVAIYSNNPNARGSLFVASYSNFDIADASGGRPRFVHAACDMTQTLHTRLESNFHFRVTFPDGSPVVTDANETYSPAQPNADCQIRALFAFRRR